MCNNNVYFKNNLHYNGIHHFEDVDYCNATFQLACLNEMYAGSKLYQVKFIDHNLRGFCNPVVDMVAWANNAKDAINKSNDWASKYNPNLGIGCSQLLDDVISDGAF